MELLTVRLPSDIINLTGAACHTGQINRMGTLRQLAGKYGWSGVTTFLRLKSGLTRQLRLRGMEHPIALRPASSDITVFKHIFAHGDYDMPIVPEPEIIVDAGANIGLAAVFFANRFRQARIIAIELSPANYKLLCHNTRNYPRIVPVQAGLWPREELLKFREEGVKPWGYRVNNDLAGENIRVRSTTIPRIMEQHGLDRIDLLKVDIEGAEVELFSENYATWLPRVKHLIIEFHDRWRAGSSVAVRRALAEFDFTEAGTVGENVVFINNQCCRE